MKLRVRPQTADDDDAIHAVLLAAFPTGAEAKLVQMLHDGFDSEISLVAEERGPLSRRIVGHVMLSRMQVDGDGRSYKALGLAPLAVRPPRQCRGIGTALVEEALRRAEARGDELVFVLGDPGYYRRFGFAPETATPFASPYAGPHFMAKSFGTALPATGKAEYAPAFARLGEGE